MSAVLDDRLAAVAALVEAARNREGRRLRVADIGTDHALLPRFLLEQAIASHVIAVEKTAAPADVARLALREYAAEVRLGDGFDALGVADELDCVTLCGMGGSLIVSLLSRYPDRIPSNVVLQANRDTPLLRAWAQKSGYHLVAETMAPGFWNFTILALERREGPDPVYDGIASELAREFGPLLLRERHPLLCAEVLERERYFRSTRALAVHRMLCAARDQLSI